MPERGAGMARREERSAKHGTIRRMKTIAAPADVAAPPADATTTSSGLASKVLKKGTGTKHPTGTSNVRVHYTGWTTDGAMFDSSVARNESISFGLNQVIRGWTEGAQTMVEGETRRFWFPRSSPMGGPRAHPGACSSSTSS